MEIAENDRYWQMLGMMGEHLKLFAAIVFSPGSIVESCRHCCKQATKPTRHDRAAKSSHDFFYWRHCACNNNNNNFYLYSAIKSNQSNCSVALYKE